MSGLGIRYTYTAFCVDSGAENSRQRRVLLHKRHIYYGRRTSEQCSHVQLFWEGTCCLSASMIEQMPIIRTTVLLPMLLEHTIVTDVCDQHTM
eukprot:1301821-Pleurochrysis_carterae.AAC.2